ncbi:hypothetical protein SRHO_G00062520 [Serrasalmus rhombeus]
MQVSTPHSNTVLLTNWRLIFIKLHPPRVHVEVTLVFKLRSSPKFLLETTESCCLSRCTGKGPTMLFYFMVVLCVSSSLADDYKNLEHNPKPCMKSDKKRACESFLFKHVNEHAPTSLDQNQWQNFIRNVINTCDRPVQSFVPFAEKQQVLGVCSPSGGKIYRDHLCVSKVEFSFTTVRVDNNCIVTSVKSEKKYLILGCDEIKNQCCPVHFESNPKNVGPADHSSDCKAPALQDHVEFALSRPSLGLLVLTLLSAAFICCKCLLKSKKSAEHKK